MKIRDIILAFSVVLIVMLTALGGMWLHNRQSPSHGVAETFFLGVGLSTVIWIAAFTIFGALFLAKAWFALKNSIASRRQNNSNKSMDCTSR